MFEDKLFVHSKTGNLLLETAIMVLLIRASFQYCLIFPKIFRILIKTFHILASSRKQGVFKKTLYKM